jgi:hypothetical protein
MKLLKKFHNEAMDLVEAAVVAQIKGNLESAAQLTRQAYELERKAAGRCVNDLAYEPTRSVLHRSAASLALRCGEYRQAERLIAVALSGEPPEEIANELRDLLEHVYFQRHLELKGISIEPDEFQLSIAGKAIGFGIAPSEEYVDRVQAFEKLVYRTVERKMGIKYRERGGPDRDIKENFEVFLSVPRAASMAVTLKIGRAKEQKTIHFPDDIEARDVIDEIVYCMEVLNSGNNKAVEEHIKDTAYYTNFVALARKIAPDGDEVNLVGVTVVRNGKKRDISLTRKSGQLNPRPQRTRRRSDPSLPPAASTAFEADETEIEVKGKLKFADSTSDKAGIIKLVDVHAEEHIIIVPEGMMSDIVRPLWDYDVVVNGIKTETGILLEEIRRDARRESPDRK